MVLDLCRTRSQPNEARSATKASEADRWTIGFESQAARSARASLPRDLSGASIVCVLGGRRAVRTAEDGAHCRRPPLPPALGSLHAVGVEPAGDLAEAGASRMLAPDVRDEPGR